MKKAVVAHAGSRDHYQLALALNEIDALQNLITDFYSPDILASVFPYMKKRYRPGLRSSKVINSYDIIIDQILQKYRKEHQEIYYRKQDGKLSNRALKKAIRNDTHLFLYSYYAYQAFKKYTGKNKKLLFQVHPHPLTVRKILREEVEKVPIAKSSLLNEAEMILGEEMLNQLSKEAELADAIVVASTFTKKSLMDNGISEDLISVVPYGVDFNKFNTFNKIKKSKGKINLIFTGNIIQRKGVFYLLQAMKLLKSDQVTLTLCGRKADQGILNEFSDLRNVNVKLNLSQKELLKELNKSDLFVFPSLVEGFGLVILEAMASGLPVITTQNTSGVDIIDNGEDGYIIPVRSVDKIAESVEKFIQEKNYLDMGMNAVRKAEKYTWQNFREGIKAFYLKNS